ncbi:leucine-rich repeat protein [Methanobrevibacter sp.]|uniref:leucine-rich repeat protein n=1 Tax=Methanobrevibacter sp. TaxID=66852 RepID=UPI00386EDED3
MAYNKYYLQKKQVSYDNGLTWEDVTPTETRQGTYIDTYQTLAECEAIDYSTQYLTFESLEDDNQIFFKLGQNNTAKTISASTDNGVTWTEYTSTSGNSGTTIATLNTGDKVLVKGTNAAYGNGNYGSTNYYNRFLGSKRFNAYGNATSLIYGDDFETSGDTIGDYAFQGIFYDSDNLISAKNLVLPSTTCGQESYANMFQHSNSLVEAPSAINAANGVSTCSEMFRGCNNLTSPPALPATTLGNGCYFYMFAGCTSLTTAPDLPATTLASNCYQHMFRGCSNLTTAPSVLPATTLAYACYNEMFYECTSLTSAPVLPATTLANSCYNLMFYNCRSLTVAPELPATTLKTQCYQSMFYGCSSLTTAPVLSATTLANYCYNQMFYNCTSLNYIKCLATDISASMCTYYWLNGVAATGTFVKDASMTGWSTGVSGIPDGWTVQNNS